MKTCKLCNESKDESAFAENAMMSDRLQPACRDCVKKQQEKYATEVRHARLRLPESCCRK